MAVIFDPVEMGVAACQCNRPVTKVHCPSCGAYTVEARKPKLNAEHSVMASCFWCRRCGNRFDDFAWKEDCQAPYQVTKKSEDRQRIIATAKAKALDAPKERLDDIADAVHSGDPNARLGGISDLLKIAGLIPNDKK